jgi:hypothetical protein
MRVDLRGRHAAHQCGDLFTREGAIVRIANEQYRLQDRARGNFARVLVTVASSFVRQRLVLNRLTRRFRAFDGVGLVKGNDARFLVRVGACLHERRIRLPEVFQR